MRTRELRAKRFKLVEDARALVTSDGSAAAQARYDRMMAEADALKAQIDAQEAVWQRDIEEMESLRSSARVAHVSLDQMLAKRKADDAAFDLWMRGGINALTPAQRVEHEKRFQAAQSESSNTGGGYTVPTGFYHRLISAEKAYGGMLDAGFVFDTDTGNLLPIPTDNDTDNVGAIIGENTQASEQDVSFSSTNLSAYTYTSKLILVPNQLLQDSAFDLGAFLVSKCGERIARATNTHFTTGDGSSKPTGVVPSATLGYTAGGSSSSGETATVSYDDLIEMEHSVDPAYRRNARWMLNDATLKVVKKIKDGLGRPMWQPALDEGDPDRLLGYPLTENQDMATPGASAKTILFGDFSAYFIRRVVGATIIRLTERYADFNQTGFIAFQRWDGNLIDAGTHSVKYLQQSST